MKTNPIFLFNGSGLKFPGPWYSLTISSNGNGSATSIAAIGKDGYTTTLSAYPDVGYQLSAYSADYGTITDNLYTFSNHDAIVNAYFEEVLGPKPSALPLSERGGEYGWDIPLTWFSSNGLSAYISAQSVDTSQTQWEGYFYMAKPNYTYEYTNIDRSLSSIGDGKFEMYLTPSDFNQFRYDAQQWYEYDGETSGFVHPAAFQPSNFATPPVGLFVTGVTPPTPTANHRYTITLGGVSSPFYVNTVCMDISSEGNGTLYDINDNELYDLEAWNDGTPNTELSVNNGSAIFYADNLTYNPPQGYFTLITDTANDSYIGSISVYDNIQNQVILNYIGGMIYSPDTWIELSYN